ncbi:MAG: transposase [Planctomycetota bacterium]
MKQHRRKLKRIENPAHLRYLTFSCYQRLPLLGNAAIRDLFVEQLQLTHDRLGFGLFAWVVMPEHVHLLVQPPSGTTVSSILAALKRPVAAQVLSRWREIDAPILSRIQDIAGRSHFWQRGGGYDRNISSLDEAREKFGYIHANPVRRGLVDRPADWAWSSAGDVGGGSIGRPVIDRLPG